MPPGARVFDTGRVGHEPPAGRAAVEVAAVPGPSGRFFSDGVLLLSADAGGLHSWDPAGGEHVGAVAGGTRAAPGPACADGLIGDLL